MTITIAYINFWNHPIKDKYLSNFIKNIDNDVKHVNNLYLFINLLHRKLECSACFRFLLPHFSKPTQVIAFKNSKS